MAFPHSLPRTPQMYLVSLVTVSEELCSAFLQWHLRHVEARCVRALIWGSASKWEGRKKLSEGKSVYPKAKPDEALTHSWILVRPALVNILETAKGGKKRWKKNPQNQWENPRNSAENVISSNLNSKCLKNRSEASEVQELLKKKREISVNQ